MIMQTTIHNCFLAAVFVNSQNTWQQSVLFNVQMVKENATWPRGILIGNKQEQTMDTHSLDESPETCGGEPGGGDPKGSMFYDSIYVTFSER